MQELLWGNGQGHGDPDRRTPRAPRRGTPVVIPGRSSGLPRSASGGSAYLTRAAVRLILGRSTQEGARGGSSETSSLPTAHCSWAARNLGGAVMGCSLQLR